MKKDLEYPLDTSLILRKRRRIRSELSSNPSLKSIRIAILGGSTTSTVREMIEIFMLYHGFKAVFFECEYGKYFEDVVVDDSSLREFSPDIAFVCTTRKNVDHFPLMFDDQDAVDKCLALEMNKYLKIWGKLTNDLGCLVIQNNFDLPTTRSLGNLDSSEIFGQTNFLMNLNLSFAEHSRQITSLIINDIFHLSARLGLDTWYDDDYWFSYKFAFTPAAAVHVGHAVVKLIRAASGLSSKCLVLDLDNTLWGGVVGDDGLMGLALGQGSARGESFQAFQSYCSELRNRGVLLAICSKNDIENAQEGFSHPDTILKLSSFTAFRANWGMKSENITQIAQEINIGLDSLVFIDDNPAERALVSSQCPEVKVPDVGQDVTNFSKFLDREGYFETVSIDSDDKKRVAAYSENTSRAVFESEFSNYGEFLDSLQMEAEVDVFQDPYLQRIHQLTNKTNQFNLTTLRCSYSDIVEMASSKRYLSLYGRLEDKFGDNGLVTAVAGTVVDGCLDLCLWLMSCRVLKRDMQLVMLDEIVGHSIALGIDKIRGSYIKTKKNNMVENHYKELGFTLVQQDKDQAGILTRTYWELGIDNYKPLNKFIKVAKK